jgi:DnaJ family protein C protein 9
MDDNDPITQFFPDDEDVNLYAVLSLNSSSSVDDIKKSYRKLALKCHPDKFATASEEARRDASTKFQQIGFAYAVLSDEKRRERYDKTGKTDDGLFEMGPGEGGWESYFEDLFGRVTREKLDEMKAAYQGTFVFFPNAPLLSC